MQQLIALVNKAQTTAHASIHYRLHCSIKYTAKAAAHCIAAFLYTVYFHVALATGPSYWAEATLLKRDPSHSFSPSY